VADNNNMPSFEEPPAPSTIERTLARQYHFDIKSLLSRAHGLVKDNFLSLFQGSLILFLAFVMLGAIAQQFITIYDDGTFTFEHQSLIEIGAMFILAPLISGLYMMGVSHARGNKTNVFSIFSYLPLIFLLALTQLVTSILVQLGLVLLIIPGIYLWMATSFSLMLVADKSLSPIRAIILSCKVFNAYWSQLTAIFGVLVLVFLSVPLTLGLSLVWVLPFYFSVLGLLYHELIGGEALTTRETPKQVSESSFDA